MLLGGTVALPVCERSPRRRRRPLLALAVRSRLYEDLRQLLLLDEATVRMAEDSRVFLPVPPLIFILVGFEVGDIADEVEGEALALLVVNKLRSTFNVLAVKAPGFGIEEKKV